MILYIVRSIKRVGRYKRGFTLVELMAVLAVLAIIVAIAVPRFTATIKVAKEKADKVTAQMIARAAEQYCMDNDDEDHADSADSLAPDYLKEKPVPQADDKNSFYYEVKNGVCEGVYYGNSATGSNLLD